MADDDEEARKRRAEWLRRRIRGAPDEPPRTPRDFVEREMDKRAADERAAGGEDEDPEEPDGAPPA